jgi:predicted nucleic acid-binding protein
MRLVIDSCVAAKLLFAEEWSAEAERLNEISDGWIAPSIALAELSNVVWKQMTRVGLKPIDAQRLRAGIPHIYNEIIAIEDLVADAQQIMIDLVHPIYDCLYLALAAREKLPLVTVDQGLIDIGGKLGTVEVFHLRDL